MNQSLTNQPKKLVVYAAGGAGINIVSGLFSRLKEKDPGFATCQPVYLDTSRANLSVVKSPEQIYLFQGKDGGGKDRGSVKEMVVESIKDPLHKFKPGDINIVVHSASGGSGSMIGPVLVNELLRRELPTLVIAIGSSDSTIEISNTQASLRAYERIAQAAKKPVVMRYFENTKSISEGEINNQVILLLLLLAKFFSGNLDRLDTSDVTNFLNFPKVTTYPPMLAGMEIFAETIDNPNDLPIVSLLTVTDSKTSSSPDMVVSYQAVGILPDGQLNQPEMKMPLHCAIFAGYFQKVIESLEKKSQEAEEIAATYVHKPISSANSEEDLFGN